jgi:multidrug efflux pump subunit AcrB
VWHHRPQDMRGHVLLMENCLPRLDSLGAFTRFCPAETLKLARMTGTSTITGRFRALPDLNQVSVMIGPARVPTYIGDVGKAENAAQIQHNRVLIDGNPSVYIPTFKQTGANTLDVIQGVTRAVGEVTGLPPGMKVSTLFSQEGTILEALHALEHEALADKRSR